MKTLAIYIFLTVINVAVIAQTRKVSFRILDENDKPVAARIRMTMNDSIYLAPEGHTVDFPFANHGGDVILDNNRRFAYVDGFFSARLAIGNEIWMEVVKGFAYRVYDRTFKISTTDDFDIRLEKWFTFPGRQWYSGDVHVHNIDPTTALLEMKAEDVNVCNVEAKKEVLETFNKGKELFRKLGE